MITIRDVAEKAGVPVKTASRALSGLTQGKRRDAKERAERVLKVAKEMGYQPSHVAQSLRSGKTRTIGMVVGGLSDRYFGCLVEAYIDELEKSGYRLLLAAIKWDEEKEYEGLKDLIRHRVDGIIYTCDMPQHLRAEHHMLLEQNFPLLTMSANEHGFGMAVHDFASAIHSAIKFLHNRKRRDIALVLPCWHRVQNIELEKAFKAAGVEFGVNTSVYCLGLDHDLDVLMDKRHDAWVVYGQHTLNRLVEDFAAQDLCCQPDMIVFCDDISWGLKPPTNICGAIFYQTRKKIEAMAKEIIYRIENNKEKREDIVCPADFVEAKNFGMLKFKEIPRTFYA